MQELDPAAFIAARSRIWSEHPVVSVIIPIFNKWELTRSCLLAVLRSDSQISLQIIVVDDGSNDESSERLTHFPGVHILRNDENLGYLRSCNRGAAASSGTYLYFLNNDTVVDARAISSLVGRIEDDPNIGVVGSKLLYPNGHLQEAGGIIWSDARGWNYGRGDAADKSQYAFVRDVDYVSGASLLVRTEIFRALGGFDERFSPAYYEDADLCFAVRAAGMRVVYEPASVVVHHEGATSGTDVSSGPKQYQAINRGRFLEKWREVLERSHCPPDAGQVENAARRQGGHGSAVLIIEETLPRYDREAAASRLWALMLGLGSRGVRVAFFPHNLKAFQPYTRQLQSLGIEVIYESPEDRRPWRERLTSIIDTVDAAWICRPGMMMRYLPAIRERSKIPVIYDTIDLHFLRLARQADIEGRRFDARATEVQELEYTCALAADATVVVSDFERQILQSLDVFPVYVIPTIHDMKTSELRNHFMTNDLLFIGGFNHQPNVDGALWLVQEILPLVWKRLPHVAVTLLGADPPGAVTALRSARVSVPGYIEDVSRQFMAARIFVAPLRFGAGIKGKIGQALSYGLPVVTTSIGSEGFGFIDHIDALIADDKAAFAAAIIELYEDDQLWSSISYRSSKLLEPFSTQRVVGEGERVIRDVTASSHRRSGIATLQGTSLPK